VCAGAHRDRAGRGGVPDVASNYWTFRAEPPPLPRPFPAAGGEGGAPSRAPPAGPGPERRRPVRPPRARGRGIRRLAAPPLSLTVGLGAAAVGGGCGAGTGRAGGARRGSAQGRPARPFGPAARRRQPEPFRRSGGRRRMWHWRPTAPTTSPQRPRLTPLVEFCAAAGQNSTPRPNRSEGGGTLARVGRGVVEPERILG
jgi:hypothetical protein